ncbi:MAG TPA: hypothetical protein DD979_17715 [Gammaproteobacteria bacterium]|nr:hypothetical protein [Gammaproteobacteria bacterium]
MTDVPADNLTDLGFQACLPSPLLRPYVVSFWAMRSHRPAVITRSEYMHHNGAVGLMFNWGDPLPLDEGCYQPGVNVDVLTPQSRQLHIAGQQHVDGFGILFKAGASFCVTGVPVAALQAHTLAPLGLRQALSFDALNDALYHADTFTQRVRVAENWLRTRLHGSFERPASIDAAIRVLDRHPGVPIRRLSGVVNLSQRQLERQFNDYLGLTPKQFGRVRRVQLARTQLKQSPTQSLAALAQHMGYVDQAHFTREFAFHLKDTPGAYCQRVLERRAQTSRKPALPSIA